MDAKFVKMVPFEHEGKNYELRLFRQGWNFTVKAFLDGQEANGYSHSIALPTAFDLKQATGMDAIQMLFEDAKSDIREKLWERYVAACLASLNLKEDEGAACQQCTERKLKINDVDGRKIFRCLTCGNVWYGRRSRGGGAYEVQVDEIADGVVQNGYHDTIAVILLNCAFRAQNGVSFEEQLQSWCERNYLECNDFYGTDRQGERCQMIRFTRKPL